VKEGKRGRERKKRREDTGEEIDVWVNEVAVATMAAAQAEFADTRDRDFMYAH